MNAQRQLTNFDDYRALTKGSGFIAAKLTEPIISVPNGAVTPLAFDDRATGSGSAPGPCAVGGETCDHPISGNNSTPINSRSRGVKKVSVEPLGPDTHLLTLLEVAERLNVSMRTVRRLVDAGALPKLCIGRSVRVSPAALAAYVTGAAA